MNDGCLEILRLLGMRQARAHQTSRPWLAHTRYHHIHLRSLGHADIFREPDLPVLDNPFKSCHIHTQRRPNCVWSDIQAHTAACQDRPGSRVYLAGCNRTVMNGEEVSGIRPLSWPLFNFQLSTLNLQLTASLKPWKGDLRIAPGKDASIRTQHANVRRPGLASTNI